MVTKKQTRKMLDTIEGKEEELKLTEDDCQNCMELISKCKCGKFKMVTKKQTKQMLEAIEGEKISKLIKGLIEKGCEILINDIIDDDKHLDSFWYDGLILTFKYQNKIYEVGACGEIRIHNKKGNLVYDCKERNEGFDFDLKTDKDLKKIGNNYTDKYYYENNNWFELCEEGNPIEVFYDLSEIKGLI